MKNKLRIFRNFVEIHTYYSLRKSDSAFTDVFDKLKRNSVSDTEIARLYNFGLPFYEDFKKHYNKRLSLEIAYRTATRKFIKELDKLSSYYLKRWDLRLQLALEDDEIAYKDIFPDGRNFYRKGTYEERIRALFVLAERMLAYAALSDIQAEVQAFAEALLALRSSQQGYEMELADIRDKLEKKRKVLSDVLYGIAGGLQLHHYDDLELAENYFDSRYFNHTSTDNDNANSDEDDNLILLTKEGSIVAGERVAIFGNNIDANTRFLVQNDGEVPLRVWVSEMADAKVSDKAIVLAAGDDAHFSVADVLGEGEEAKLLIIANPAGSLANYVASVLA